jgi:hypothetical protein
MGKIHATRQDSRELRSIEMVIGTMKKVIGRFGSSDSLTTEMTHATSNEADNGFGDRWVYGGWLGKVAGGGRTRGADLHWRRADDRIHPAGMGGARCAG